MRRLGLYSNDSSAARPHRDNVLTPVDSIGLQEKWLVRGCMFRVFQGSRPLEKYKIGSELKVKIIGYRTLKANK